MPLVSDVPSTPVLRHGFQKPRAPLPGLADVVAVACGEAHSACLAAGGEAHAWGDNSTGQCGAGGGLLGGPSTVLGALVAMVGVQLASKYPTSYMGEEAFWEHDWPYRLGYQWLAVSLYRYKYYFGWLLAEGACNLAGLGYAPATDKKAANWQLVSNVEVRASRIACLSA